MGPIVENFVAMEILKQISWSDSKPRLYHYRTPTRNEVDLLLTNRSGQMVGIEVKSTTSPSAQDFKGLKHLANSFGDHFTRGILFHMGKESVAFGPNLLALPIETLWRYTK